MSTTTESGNFDDDAADDRVSVTAESGPEPATHSAASTSATSASDDASATTPTGTTTGPASGDASKPTEDGAASSSTPAPKARATANVSGTDRAADGAAAPVTAAAEAGRIRSAGRWVRRHRSGIGVAAISTLAIASVATATSLYFTQYRPDQQTDDAAKHAAVQAATDGSIAILSYAPDTLDQDLDAAKSFLTGDFLNYYSQFTQKVVAPTASQKAVKTQAAVVRSAVEEMEPDSAQVLVFINQTTTTSDKPDPSMTSSSVKVSMSQVDGEWLISAFEPV